MNLNIKILNKMTVVAMVLGMSAGTSYAVTDKVIAQKSMQTNRVVSIKEDKQLSSYVHKKAAAINDRMVMDMADEKQYQFVINRLSKNGKSPKNSPRLFQLLRDLRGKHQHLKKLQLTPQEVMKSSLLGRATANNDGREPEPFEIMSMNLAEHLPTGKKYVLNKTYTVLGAGKVYAYTDTIVRKPDMTQIGEPGATEIFDGEGETRMVATASMDLKTIATLYPDIDYVVVDSIRIMEIPDNQLTGLAQLQKVKDIIEFTKTQYDLTSMAYAAEASPSTVDIDRVAPKDINGDETIMVCTNRNVADCDYGWNQAGEDNPKTNLTIPFQGIVTLPHRILKIYGPNDDQPISVTDQTTGIWIATKENGDSVELKSPNGKVFFDYLDYRVDEDTKTSSISWTIDRDDGYFGNVVRYERYELVDWWMHIVVEADMNFVPRRSATFTIIEDNIEPINTNFYAHHEPFKFAWGCVAEGTPVSMADGTQKAIEAVKQGDWVRTQGQDMMVIEQTNGVESKPMFRINAENGKSIFVTAMHPIPTANRGTLWASEIVNGDTIFTEQGLSRVASVVSEKFAGNVYNLRLGHPDSEQADKVASNRFIAGGIQVGDQSAQEKYANKQQQTTHEHVLNVLKGTGWEEDYKYSRGIQ